MFEQYDSDGGGFIQRETLGSVLRDLEMDASEQTISGHIASALVVCGTWPLVFSCARGFGLTGVFAPCPVGMDAGGLGVILKPSFLDALFPEAGDGGPKDFVVYHYNGIAKPGTPLRYVRGCAKVQPPTDFGSTPIMQCLRTKWQPLDIQWDGPASIN